MDKAERLIKVNTHLGIALAELNKIAGGSYAGSLRELKELISVKLKLERIYNHVNFHATREKVKD